MERTRHGTGSDAHHSTIQPIMADMDSDDSFSSTGRRAQTGSQSSTGSAGGRTGSGAESAGRRPGYGADLDGAQDADDLKMTYNKSDSSGEDDAARKPNQLRKKGPGDNTSLGDAVTHRKKFSYESPEQERLDMIHPVEAPSVVTDLPSGDNLFPLQ